MTDNECMVVIIKWMISQATNQTYIEQLKMILAGIEGYKHIEETRSPSYQSILLFGKNIFPFKMKDYGLMAQEIMKGNLINE